MIVEILAKRLLVKTCFFGHFNHTICQISNLTRKKNKKHNLIQKLAEYGPL